MKRSILVAAFVLLFPFSLMAADIAAQVYDLCEEKGGTANCKVAVDIATKALAANPNGYTENWVMAQALRTYTDYYKRENKPGWKELCKTNGKKAMGYAEKAISLKPDGVEGHFWYGTSVGTYSDGVSIVTALKEGLKNKTQAGFEKAYAANKMYNKGGPMKALGRFWSVLPFPLKNKKKALEYLAEYSKYFPDNAEGQVFYGQALIDSGKKKEAKDVLEKAAASSDKYYAAEAKKLLADL
ncbi:MAG TPA: tetratricopeptide repeat protein [Deltaproteobacteria bacterium]|nr:tetratricopeptide repeat protein [Deltaproteobacteria bacterium]